MDYYVQAYDKHGLQVLGNMHGQGRIIAKSLKGLRRTNAYKAIKSGALAGDRIEQYSISVGYDQSAIERIWIQDLTEMKG